MIKILYTVLILASCSAAPEGFCDCLEQGDKLNKITNEVLRGDLSKTKKNEMLSARKEKKEACAAFLETDGNEMLEWKKSCKD
jgi:hypothetical protein